MPVYIRRNADNSNANLTLQSRIPLVAGSAVELMVQLRDAGGTERLFMYDSGSNWVAIVNTGQLRAVIAGTYVWGQSIIQAYTQPIVLRIEKTETGYVFLVDGNQVASYSGAAILDLHKIFHSVIGDFYYMRHWVNDTLTNDWQPVSGQSVVPDSVGTNDLVMNGYDADPFVTYHAIESVTPQTFNPGQKVTLVTSAGFNPNSFTLDDGTKTCSPDLVSEAAADTYSFTLPLGNIEGFCDFGGLTATMSNGSETATAQLTMAVPGSYTLQQLNAGILRDETTVSWQFAAHPSGGAFYLFDATKIVANEFNELSILAGETYTTTAYLIDGQGIQEFVVSEGQAPGPEPEPIPTTPVPVEHVCNLGDPDMGVMNIPDIQPSLDAQQAAIELRIDQSQAAAKTEADENQSAIAALASALTSLTIDVTNLAGDVATLANLVQVENDATQTALASSEATLSGLINGIQFNKIKSRQVVLISEAYTSDTNVNYALSTPLTDVTKAFINVLHSESIFDPSTESANKNAPAFVLTSTTNLQAQLSTISGSSSVATELRAAVEVIEFE